MAEGSPPHTRGKASFSMMLSYCSWITPAYAGKSSSPQPAFPARTDHPRIRGEKHRPQNVLHRKIGSPPHTRGKAPGGVGVGAPHGITPAYAGKSTCTRAAGSCGKDHPRIRGEKLEGCFIELSKVGSPPHTRGKAGVGAFSVPSPGITPAYAGKSR